MSDNAADEWRWVSEDGTETSLTEGELISKLSSEELPAYTFIWRAGWGEWLPAMQVAELSWALPAGKADTPLKPKEGSGGKTPAPPLYRYPAVKKRAAGLERGSIRPPAPARPKKERVKADRSPPAPDEVTRVVAPSFAEEDDVDSLPSAELVSAPATLDPATLALPDQQTYGAYDDAPTQAHYVDMTNDVTIGSYADGDEEVTRIADTDLSQQFAHVAPRHVDPPTTPFMPAPVPDYSHQPQINYGDEEYEEAEPLDDALVVYDGQPGPASVSPEMPAVPPAPRAFDPAAPAENRSRRILLLGSVVSVLAAAVVILLLGPKDPTSGATPIATADPTATPNEEASSAPGVASNANLSPKPCLAGAASPTRLGEWAALDVTPEIGTIPNSRRLAVGYAQTSLYAIGMTVDAETLDMDRPFQAYRKEPVTSVVPIDNGSSLRFIVDRAGGALTMPRTVNAPTPFALGGATRGLSSQVGRSEPNPVWPGVSADVTEPMSAKLLDGSFAVTFREGKKDGKIRVGIIEPNAAARGGLAEVSSSAKLLGAPVIAAGTSGIALVFTGRPTEADPWRVYLARARDGELPTQAVVQQLPPDGPGGAAVAPRIAALSGQRWLLMWTEGDPGSRVVRAITLDDSLQMVGAPLSLSLPAQQAGRGALMAAGDHVLVLFYVMAGEAHELWGASVNCQR